MANVIGEENMKVDQTQDERREFKRFRIKAGSSFVSTPHWPEKGVLVDISKGGFAFHYNSAVPWPEIAADGCLVSGEHDSWLNKDVPLEVVADRIAYCGQGNTMMVRRRSLKFGPLNLQQKFMLECFIWINSTGHC